MRLKEKLKRKSKNVGLKPTTYWKIIEETRIMIRKEIKIVTNKMWVIGKVLHEQKSKLTKKQLYTTGFYKDVAIDEITPEHLRMCEKFYRAYPNLQEKIKETGLTPTHYERLSHVAEEERDKFEQIAIEENLTVGELREKLYPPLPESVKEQKTPEHWVNMQVERNLETRQWLTRPKVWVKINKRDRTRLRRSLVGLRNKIDWWLDRVEKYE